MTMNPERVEMGPESIPTVSLDSFCPGVSHHTCSEGKLKPPPSIDSKLMPEFGGCCFHSINYQGFHAYHLPLSAPCTLTIPSS